jgi:hypothetical protein
MNHKQIILLVGLSALLSLLVSFFLKDAYFIIIATFPLILLKKKWAFTWGFLDGFVAFLLVYLQYSHEYIIRISGIIGSVIGLPYLVIIILYPLLAAVIGGFSGLLWSSILEYSGKKERKGLVEIRNN